jgi:hypothetical protein
MNEAQPTDQDVSFGEQLLGMQGFSAARARKYRAEVEKLLVNRLSRSQRWTMGLMGIWLAAALGILGMMSVKLGNLEIAASFLGPGLLMGGWLIWAAVRGGFSRRLGDVMAIAILLAFAGSFAFVIFWEAWDVQDQFDRQKLLIGGGTLVACIVFSVLLVEMQRMHRQTREKLLRIEYHLAELMERNAGSFPP